MTSPAEPARPANEERFFKRDGDVVATRPNFPHRGGTGTYRVIHPAIQTVFRKEVRPRVVVVSPRAAAAVRFTGGWLFDLATAGWNAAVLAADHTDPRALGILGVSTADLDSVLAAPARGIAPHVIAVEAELCGSDVRVRRIVQDALDRGMTEVRLWGDTWPECVDAACDSVQHRLSAAARAFKAHALKAASAPVDAIPAMERFRSVKPPGIPGAPDLIRAR